MATKFIPKYFKNLSKMWSIVFLVMFVFFSYRNILQQTEIGVRLPNVNLVHVLNNFEVFTKDPTSEKVDTYLSLGKIFETFKYDYMKHYDEYALMLYTYITLEESEIAFKFYAHKQFFEKVYMREDYFSLGTAITEFVKNFYTRDFRSKVNIFENKHYQLLRFNDNKSKCEDFFNAYVYPLYLAQNKQQEITIAKDMNTVFTLWATLKTFQVIIFISSIVYLGLVCLVFILQKVNQIRFFKNQLSVGVILFIALSLLLASFVSSFTSLCICLSMYNKQLNYKGGYNALFNLVQIMYIMLIIYFSLNWVKDLRVELSMEKQKETTSVDKIYLLKHLGGHTIKRHFKSFLKKEENNKGENDVSSIIAKVGTAVTHNPLSTKRIMKNINPNHANESKSKGKTIVSDIAQTAASLTTALTVTNAPPTSFTGTDQKFDTKSDSISMETAQLLETVPFSPKALDMITQTSLDQPTAQFFNISDMDSVLNETSQSPTDGSSSGISKDYLTYTNVPLSSVITSKLKYTGSTKPRLSQIKEDSSDPISGVTTPFVSRNLMATLTGTETSTVTGSCTSITESINAPTNGKTMTGNVSSFYPGTSRYTSSEFNSSQFTKTLSSKSSSSVGLAAMGITNSNSPNESIGSRKNSLHDAD